MSLLVIGPLPATGPLAGNRPLAGDQLLGRQPATRPTWWVRGLDLNQRHLGWQPRVLPLNYPGVNLLNCFRTLLYHGMMVRLVCIKASTGKGTGVPSRA